MNIIKKNLKTVFSVLRKLGALKVVAILFGIMIMFVIIVEKPGSSSSDKVVEGQPLLFPRITLEEMTHISFLSSDEGAVAIELRKENDGWMIDETKARDELVGELVQSILVLKKQDIVSKKKQFHKDFGVSSDSGTFVQVWKNSKQLAGFYAGEDAGTNSQYIRIEKSDEVIQASPSISGLLRKTVEEWQGKSPAEEHAEEGIEPEGDSEGEVAS